MAKVGVWLVGAQGSLASTVVLGARAIARRLATGGGLVTELPDLAALPFVPLADLAFGGWDIAPTGLVARARELAADGGAVAESLVTGLEADLKSVEMRIRPGFALGGALAARPRETRAFRLRGEWVAVAVERLGDDLDRFRREERLDTVIVVNVASTEPPTELSRDHERLDLFRRVIQRDRRALVTPSMVYAYAALERGFPYVNFTPSGRRAGASGAGVEASRALLRERRQDGRDAGEDGPRADVPLSESRGPVLGGLQHPGRGRRTGTRGSSPQALEGPEQVGSSPLCARLYAPLGGGDRVRPVPRQLEDGVGLRPLPGIPRHEDERAVHLAGVRLDPGGAARPRPGAPHGARPAPGRGGPHDPSGVLLQRAPRRERAGFHRPVPPAHRLRRAPHAEREEGATGAVNPPGLPILAHGDH